LADLQAEHEAMPPRSRRRWVPAEQQEGSAVRNYIRDLILGFNDGLVSVFAVVAGVVGASFGTTEIAVAGLAAAIAGALSMGIGEYLSTKSQTAFYEHERRLERQHIRDFPQLEQQELREMLEEKGVRPELAAEIVSDAASDPDRLLDLMMREEFGLGVETERSPIIAMALVMGAFIVGAAAPVVPFLFPVSVSSGFLVASVLSVLGLYGAGHAKARVSGLSGFKGGAEMAVLGVLAALITYGVGYVVGVSV